MRTVRTGNGMQFAVLEQGKGPLALLMHGFPDTPHTWRHLMPLLADAGYHAVAPFMRGYPPTSAAPDGDYSIGALGNDVVALIDAHEAEAAVVIGHDWGAAAAFMAANTVPERVSKLVTLAIPHMGAIAPTGLTKAWHFALFQLPGIERWVRRNDFAAIERTWRRWSPNWQFEPGELRPIKDCLGTPGGLRAALSYYRHLPMLYTRSRGRAMRRIGERRTGVPSLAIGGTADAALNTEGFDRSRHYYTGPYELVRVGGAGHFVQQEAPAQVADAILSFLAD